MGFLWTEKETARLLELKKVGTSTTAIKRTLNLEFHNSQSIRTEGSVSSKYATLFPIGASPSPQTEKRNIVRIHPSEVTNIQEELERVRSERNVQEEILTEIRKLVEAWKPPYKQT